MILKSEAIKNWMSVHGVDDLKDRYHKGMEVQVNVIPGGDRIEKEFMGRSYNKFSDGISEWGPFRIPRFANTDPEDNDGNLNWIFEEHLQAIGMTGWNWQDKVSEYVGFDFDSITSHTQGLQDADLSEVYEVSAALDYVTVRRSTSGSGYHLEVHVDNIPTATHTEHAALARSILGKMCSDTGYNFESTIDCCGGVLWIWATKQVGTNGLEILKQGVKLTDIKKNWRDHIPVIKGDRKKIKPKFVRSDGEEDKLMALLMDKPIIRLDDGHQMLIKYLEEIRAQSWWDADHNMLVCHTHDLKKAHTDLGLIGVFETDSSGSSDQNCFAFPLSSGGWSIRRHTRGVNEHNLWTQDGKGWTKCYFNVTPDLESASKSVGGIEDAKARFKFSEAAVAVDAARILGADASIPPNAANRDSMLYKSREGKLVFRIERKPNDEGFRGWLAEDRGKVWQKVFNVHADRPVQPEVECHDDLIRHLVSSQRSVDMGWVVYTQDRWVDESKANCVDLLISQGIPHNKTRVVMGNCVKSPYLLVNHPFDDEYLGDRKWNRSAAKLKFKPRKVYDSPVYPTWQSILQHCGAGLDLDISKDEWCQSVGIKNGSDYLKCWIASMFQTPQEPLPYLFFYGPENSGKSSFHESLRMLMSAGYVRADHALSNDTGYNAELANAVLCVVEEINLANDKRAMNRIKDWVTGMDLSIHEKKYTPIMLENCTHWVQMSNDKRSCPVNFGDTRITYCYVDTLDSVVPRRELQARLLKEAPDFITEIMHVEIPRPDDRLGLKVIDTADKIGMSELSEPTLSRFLRNDVFDAPGYVVPVAEMYLKYKTLYPEARESQRVFTSSLNYVRARTLAGNGHGLAGIWSFGNVSLTEPTKEKTVLVNENDYLV